MPRQISRPEVEFVHDHHNCGSSTCSKDRPQEPVATSSSLPAKSMQFQLKLKRATDLALCLGATIVGAPIFALTALAIKLDSPGPVIFKQRRVGVDGQFFEIYKFRTMKVGTPNVPTEEMLKLPNPVTRVGHVLRRTSLDELPQLFNVLKGEMSLVGPRPALYNQEELTAKRLACGVLKFPPGITGWAQVNGRDELADDVKVEADRWYCDNWSYWLDWRIIAKTFDAVLSKRGAF